jgi:menaquinone-9 beta-reductase
MTWDALVIGAGPAGSVTARELSRRGCRVLLVDRAFFPRTKVCGSCLNGAAIRALERIGLGRVLAGGVALDSFTVAAGSRQAEIPLPRGLALSREVLDARLVNEAVKAGAEFRPGTVVTRDSELLSRAKITIVASGLTGSESPADRVSRIGAGAILAADAAPDFYGPHTIHMAVGRGGYVGLVRIEDDRLDVAAAFDPSFVKASGGLGPAAGSILGEVGWPASQGLIDATWKGTAALTRRPRRVAGDGVFVVGDAAGYIEPFTGEGMAWAVTSAAALAPIAARAVHGWDDSLAREWEAAHRMIVRRRQRVCRAISSVLRSRTLTGIAIRTLRMIPSLSRPVVAALNRPVPRHRGSLT